MFEEDDARVHPDRPLASGRLAHNLLLAPQWPCNADPHGRKRVGAPQRPFHPRTHRFPQGLEFLIVEKLCLLPAVVEGRRLPLVLPMGRDGKKNASERCADGEARLDSRARLVDSPASAHSHVLNTLSRNTAIARMTPMRTYSHDIAMIPRAPAIPEMR